MSDLKKYIIKHYGTDTACAKALGITRQTVNNWVTKNPRGMLKFAPEIVAKNDTTWTQLSGEVLNREDELNKK